MGKVTLLVFALSSCLSAQSTHGSIVGNVKDPQESAVPGAGVTIENLDTGQKVETKSDATGNYRAFPLPPGRYNVNATAPGLRTTTVSGVRLDLDSTVRVDILMPLEAVQSSVTVEASGTTLIQTDTSTLESVVENRQIIDLPLDGRNVDDLVYLTPGTVENTVSASVVGAPLGPT